MFSNRFRVALISKIICRLLANDKTDSEYNVIIFGNLSKASFYFWPGEGSNLPTLFFLFSFGIFDAIKIQSGRNNISIGKWNLVYCDFNYSFHGNCGCSPFAKSFRKICLESKWSTTSWDIPAKNSGSNGTSEKVVQPVFRTECSKRKFCSISSKPSLDQLQAFKAVFWSMELICTLMVTTMRFRDEIKFISLEFCLLFTQILNRPVCPQPVTLCIRFVSSYKAVLSLSKKNDKSEGRVQNNVRFSS